MAEVKLKSPADIKAKLRDTLHAAQKRFIEQHSSPCPGNCRHAPVVGTKQQPCPKCHANPGEPCKIKLRFEQRHTYDDLVTLFKARASQKGWLSREEKGAYMLLWVLGQIDAADEPDPSPLPNYLQAPQEGKPIPWIHLDGNTMLMSDEVAALFAGFLDRLAERMPPA